jgi:hypothetical protein
VRQAERIPSRSGGTARALHAFNPALGAEGVVADLAEKHADELERRVLELCQLASDLRTRM